MADLRKRLSQKDVKARVAEIRRHIEAQDWERAHMGEDKLLRELAEDFAALGYSIFEIALSTHKIEFPRHCA